MHAKYFEQVLFLTACTSKSETEIWTCSLFFCFVLFFLPVLPIMPLLELKNIPLVSKGNILYYALRTLLDSGGISNSAAG